MLSIRSIKSRDTALRYYGGLRRSQRGLYIHDRVSHDLPTYITRNFLPSDESGRVDVQYVLSMIDYTHAVACNNMHAPDSNLLPKTLSDNDKADYVTITNGFKKEISFFQREFIQSKFLDIFYPDSSINWKEKKTLLNAKMAGHIRNNETAKMIEILSKVYNQHSNKVWCEEFMKEKLLVYKDAAVNETGCIQKLFTVNFNEVTKTFPSHVNKMSPQELEDVETVADFKYTGEGKRILFQYLQGKEVELEKYLLKHPEDEVSLFVGKKRSIQMCLPAAFASSKKVRHVPVTPQESSSEHDKFSPQAHDEKAFHTPSQSKLDSAPRIPILSACKAPSFSSSSDGTIDLLDDKKISASTLPSKQEAIILDDSDDEVEIVKKSVKKVNYVSEDVFEVPERIRKNEEALKKEKEDKLARIEARAKEAKKANEEKKKEAKKANEEKKKAKEAEKLRKEQEKREKKAALKAAKEAKEAKEAKKAAGKDQEKKDKKGKEGKKKDLEKAVVVKKEEIEEREWNEKEWDPMVFCSKWIPTYGDLACVKCHVNFEDTLKEAKGVVYFHGGAKGVRDGGMLCFSCKEEIFANAGSSRRSSRGGMKENTKNSDKKKKN